MNSPLPHGGRAACSALALLLASAVVAGCGSLGLGPNEIARGRSVYNDVLNRTDDEQMLTAIVRTRYGLSSGMLSVQAVTANLSVSGSATGQFNIGPEDLWRENLVPLEIGVAFEENPTISYVPIQGKEAVISLLAPISVETLALVTRAADVDERRRIFSLFVERLNGLPHPALDQPGSEEFSRAIGLLGELVHAGVADFGRASKAEGGEIQIVVFDYQADHRETVTEAFRLLRLAPPPADGRDVRLPLRLAVGSPDGTSINVRTRSVLDLMRIAAASVQVPPEHADDGLVQPLPHWAEAMGEADTVVRVAKSPPADAAVAIPHDGFWYYIDRRDHRGKTLFRILATLFDMRISVAQNRDAAPVLTLPVN